jgi:cell division protein FtsQ
MSRRRRPRRSSRRPWWWPGLKGWAALAVLILLVTGFARLRESSLVQVREVSITGIDGRAAPAIRRALRQAATDMTTLHVRRDELRRAVAPYPIVNDLEVSKDFPHGLAIRVIEYDAVAVVVLAGHRIPVAADGTLLRDERVPAGLPTVSVREDGDGERLSDHRALGAVAVLGAAPGELRPLIDDVHWDIGGLHVKLRTGPRLDFGGSGRPRAKWIAAARVLSDPRAAGAVYLDLRIPGRPLAGTFADDILAQQMAEQNLEPAEEPAEDAVTATETQGGAEVETRPTLEER